MCSSDLAAVAANDGGDSLRDFEGHVGLREQRLVVVRVCIDEARGHDEALRVHHVVGGVALEIADGGDASAGDGHIGVKARRARAVDDGTASDQQVMNSLG